MAEKRCVLKQGGSKSESSAIRVVHVVDPTPIKTTVSEFRDIVQKLTGQEKPSLQSGGSSDAVFNLPKGEQYRSAAVNGSNITDILPSTSGIVADHYPFAGSFTDVIGDTTAFGLGGVLPSEHVSDLEFLEPIGASGGHEEPSIPSVKIV